jgi:hypothetical protein
MSDHVLGEGNVCRTVKQSRYTPWRRLGGEEVYLLPILDLGNVCTLSKIQKQLQNEERYNLHVLPSIVKLIK